MRKPDRIQHARVPYRVGFGFFSQTLQKMKMGVCPTEERKEENKEATRGKNGVERKKGIEKSRKKEGRGG